MMFIIDLLGEDEMVVVGGETAKSPQLIEVERIKREEAIYEIAIRAPQPQIVQDS